VSPPTFVFFVNEAKLFGEDYRRYMEKQIRQNVAVPRDAPAPAVAQQEEEGEPAPGGRRNKNLPGRTRRSLSYCVSNVQHCTVGLTAVFLGLGPAPARRVQSLQPEL